MPAVPLPTDCLEALLGLSSDGLACLALPGPTPAGVPADNTGITASTSGYYLDRLEGLQLGRALRDAAPDAYERLAKARRNAAQRLRSELLRGAGYGTPRFQARGVLGRQGNGQAAPLGTVPRMTLYTADGLDGQYRVSGIRLNTTAPALDVPVLLDGREVARLATTAGGLFQSVDFVIPLDGYPHVVTATLPDGIRPLLGSLHCSACQAGTPWGIAVGQRLRDVGTAATSGGFELQVAEECTVAGLDILCYALKYPDLGQMLGQALYFRAGASLVQDLLPDAALSRYTVLEPKYLPALGAKYDADAQAAVDWLAGPEGLGRVQHPCYECVKPAWQPSVSAYR